MNEPVQIDKIDMKEFRLHPETPRIVTIRAVEQGVNDSKILQKAHDEQIMIIDRDIASGIHVGDLVIPEEVYDTKKQTAKIVKKCRLLPGRMVWTVSHNTKFGSTTQYITSDGRAPDGTTDYFSLNKWVPRSWLEFESEAFYHGRGYTPLSTTYSIVRKEREAAFRAKLFISNDESEKIPGLNPLEVTAMKGASVLCELFSDFAIKYPKAMKTERIDLDTVYEIWLSTGKKPELADFIDDIKVALLYPSTVHINGIDYPISYKPDDIHKEPYNDHQAIISLTPTEIMQIKELPIIPAGADFWNIYGNRIRNNAELNDLKQTLRNNWLNDKYNEISKSHTFIRRVNLFMIEDESFHITLDEDPIYGKLSYIPDLILLDGDDVVYVGIRKPESGRQHNSPVDQLKTMWRSLVQLRNIRNGKIIEKQYVLESNGDYYTGTVNEPIYSFAYPLIQVKTSVGGRLFAIEPEIRHVKALIEMEIALRQNNLLERDTYSVRWIDMIAATWQNLFEKTLPITSP